MQKYSIPTAAYRNFDLSLPEHLESAKQYIQAATHKVVIKASGLATGKRVVLPDTKENACQELETFVQGRFREARLSVVIEEFMEGDEISFLTFSDGKTFKSLAPGSRS